MRGRVTNIVIIPTEQEYDELESLLRNHRTSRLVYNRARIILLITRGEGITEIGRKCQCSRKNVYKWIKRFKSKGVEGLKERPRFAKYKKFTLPTEPLREGRTYCMICCKPWVESHTCMELET